jgi:hypothetical protein
MKDELKASINKTSDEYLQKTNDPEKVEKLRVLRSFCLKDIEQDGALSAKVMEELKSAPEDIKERG